MWFYIIISVFTGLTLVVSRIINSNLAEKIGIIEGTVYNYITGLIISFVFLLFIQESPPNLQTLVNIPIWAYLGGTLGIITVMLSSYVTPKIPAFYVSIFIFVGQLFIGVLIDFFSMHVISMGKVFGGVLVFVGLLFNLMIDREKEAR